MAKPIATDVRVSFESNLIGPEPSWVELRFDPPVAVPAWIGLDLASGPDFTVEAEFRPDWPGIWHLQAVAARPL
jgi:hypothetical protein